MGDYDEKNPARKNITEDTPDAKTAEFCSNCGAELHDNQEFCHRCGQKVKLVYDTSISSDVNRYNDGSGKLNQKKMKTPVIIAIVIIALITIAGVKLAPKIFIDVEDYLAQANYEKAYEKAKSDDDRLMVKFENIAAVQSAYSADYLKNPSSFTLRDAYYQEGINEDGTLNAQIVLYIIGSKQLWSQCK